MERHQHASQPKPVARSKFREPAVDENEEAPANIHFDRRVRRGATMGRPTLVTADTPSTKPVVHTKTLAQRLEPEPDTLRHILKHAVASKPRVPVPVHLFLEEQTTGPVPVTETDTQTDEFLDNVARPVYIRPKIGVDVRIQVETAMVFNFDRDADPLLDMLVSKTLEQALVETHEEQQLRAIDRKKTVVLESQRAEARRIKQMEFEEVALHRAKAAKLAAYQAQAARENVVRRKIAALTAARAHLAAVPAGTFHLLSSESFFRDPIVAQIQDSFLPWLVTQTNAVVQQLHTGRLVTDACIATSVDKYVLQQRAIADRMPYRLFIHWAPSRPTAEPIPAIGPVEVPHNATTAQVRHGVVTYLADPHLHRPDLRELIEVAVLERHGVAALATFRQSHPAPAREEDAPEPAASAGGRIKFFAGTEEVEGTASLRQLAADGRLAKIEMRIELAA